MPDLIYLSLIIVMSSRINFGFEPILPSADTCRSKNLCALGAESRSHTL